MTHTHAVRNVNGLRVYQHVKMLPRLRYTYLAISGYQQIAWLQISVEDANSMHSVNTWRHLCVHEERGRKCEDIRHTVSSLISDFLGHPKHDKRKDCRQGSVDT